MRFPDITPAQIIGAIFAAILPVLTLIGVDLSAAQTGALNDLYVVAIGLFGADAAIRVGRNVNVGLSNRGSGVPLVVDETDGELDREEATEALRASLGREPTDAEVDKLLDEGQVPPEVAEKPVDFRK